MMNWLNGHMGLFHAVVNNLTDDVVSMFAAQSITMFVPFYTEAVIVSLDYLIGKEQVLPHLVAMFEAEWAMFCRRVFLEDDCHEVLREIMQRPNKLGHFWIERVRKYHHLQEVSVQRFRGDPPPQYWEVMEKVLLFTAPSSRFGSPHLYNGHYPVAHIMLPTY